VQYRGVVIIFKGDDSTQHSKTATFQQTLQLTVNISHLKGSTEFSQFCSSFHCQYPQLQTADIFATLWNQNLGHSV